MEGCFAGRPLGPAGAALLRRKRDRIFEDAVRGAGQLRPTRLPRIDPLLRFFLVDKIFFDLACFLGGAEFFQPFFLGPLVSDGLLAFPLLGKFLGLTHSRHVILKLSGLFALDSFAGGFVIQSLAAYWFYLRFGVQPRSLGAIFFWANVFAGISALLASRIAACIGLVRTMVFTHLPSNILLILVPLMPNLSLAVAVLLLRFSISQMDVPTRQSYTMAVVAPEERSAAGGITGVARTAGAAISPFFAGLLFARTSLISVPFFIAGALKILYDLLLYTEFVAVRPPEEDD